MISMENHNGTIHVSESYFSSLVEHTVSQCVGVTGMAGKAKRAFLFKNKAGGTGVDIREKDGKLEVDIHVVVSYGLNIAAAVENIIEKVTYALETSTGMTVGSVNVYVDAMTD